MDEFRKELEILINKCSKELGSNTPDYILAEYLITCLTAFDKTTNQREQWYGRQNNPDSPALIDTEEVLVETEESEIIKAGT